MSDVIDTLSEVTLEQLWSVYKAALEYEDSYKKYIETACCPKRVAMLPAIRNLVKVVREVKGKEKS